MGFFLLLLFDLALYAVGQLLAPKGIGESPKPGGLGDLSIPTAEEGRPVPILMGTGLVRGGNVLWYGDFSTQSIKVEIDGGLFGPKHAWIGFRYYLGMQMGLVMGVVDEVLEIRFDDRSLPNGNIRIDSSNDSILVSRNSVVVDDCDSFDLRVAVIPHGTYPSVDALCAATSEAIYAVQGERVQCWYGFFIIAGMNDEFTYNLNYTGVGPSGKTFKLRPGHYLTGAELAAEMNYSFARAEKFRTGSTWPNPDHSEIRLACTYDVATGLFRFSWDRTSYGTTNGVDAVWFVSTPSCAVFGDVYGADLVGTLFTDTFADSRNVDGTPWAIGDPVVVPGDIPRRGATSFAFGYGASFQRINWHCGGTARELFGGDQNWNQGIGIDAVSIGTVFGYDCPIARPFTNGPATYSQIDADLTRIVVSAPTLFGDYEKGPGGVVGNIDVYMGTDTQPESDYLKGAWGLTEIPAYRGLCYAVFRHFYWGNDAYMRPVAFVLKRVPNGLGVTDGMHDISGDANPACAIFDILTNDLWGCGIPSSFIDDANFKAVAEVLFDEHLGISMLFENSMSAVDMVREILRTVDGTMFLAPDTGKLTLVLARNDYDPDDLPELTVDEISECKMIRPSWGETRNVVKVTYIDRSARLTERVAQAMDSANIWARNGEVAAEELDFRGLSNAAQAQAAAARALKVMSYPLSRFELTVDRSAWRLRPGSVFKLTWAPLGISGMVCRVIRAQTGELEDGRIRIEATEDVFGVDWTGYTAPVPADWTDPLTDPSTIVADGLVEVPRAMLGGDHRIVSGMCAATNAVGMQSWVEDPSTAVSGQTNSVTTTTPSGVLVIDLIGLTSYVWVEDAVNFSAIANISRAELQRGVNLLLIDDEWIAFSSIAENPDGTWTLTGLVRGCLDSTPKDHPAGARVWAYSYGYVYCNPTVPLPSDVTLSARIVPVSARGEVDVSSTPLVSVVTDSRAKRPSVPAKITINGASYPSFIGFDDLVVGWAHRDRTSTTQDYAEQNATEAIEAGTHYRVTVYADIDDPDDLPAPIHVEDGLTGTEWTYPLADETTDNGGVATSTLFVVVEALNGDGLVSRQAFRWLVNRLSLSGGYGSDYGTSFGPS